VSAWADIVTCCCRGDKCHRPLLLQSCPERRPPGRSARAGLSRWETLHPDLESRPALQPPGRESKTRSGNRWGSRRTTDNSSGRLHRTRRRFRRTTRRSRSARHRSGDRCPRCTAHPARAAHSPRSGSSTPRATSILKSSSRSRSALSAMVVRASHACALPPGARARVPRCGSSSS